jgi:hypothetical protein
MHIMQIIKHSPESCPLGNPKKLEVMIRWLEQIESIAAKHGIKVLAVLTDRWGHTSWAFFESPNMEAFSKFEQKKRCLFSFSTRSLTSKA